MQLEVDSRIDWKFFWIGSFGFGRKHVNKLARSSWDFVVIEILLLCPQHVDDIARVHWEFAFLDAFACQSQSTDCTARLDRKCIKSHLLRSPLQPADNDSRFYSKFGSSDLSWAWQQSNHGDNSRKEWRQEKIWKARADYRPLIVIIEGWMKFVLFVLHVLIKLLI